MASAIALTAAFGVAALVIAYAVISVIARREFRKQENREAARHMRWAYQKQLDSLNPAREDWWDHTGNFIPNNFVVVPVENK